MEDSFDIGSLLKKHRKHKTKPLHFESVAGGVQKRLTNNLKYRKSTRLTSFDTGRNLSELNIDSDVETQRDVEQVKPNTRRQQLLKWKEEKENQKKLQQKNKKKPFISAVKASDSIKYAPPPPLPLRAMPSTSGRVTRSQSAQERKKQEMELQISSFAPKNARFHAPVVKIRNMSPKKEKDNISSNTFDSIMPSSSKPAIRQSRSRAYMKIVAECKQARSSAKNSKTKNSFITVPKKTVRPQIVESSSSEVEPLEMSSGSSKEADFTAKMLSSDTEDNNNSSQTNSSTENVPPIKYLQSSSSSELEIDKRSPVNKTKKSLASPSISTLKSKTMSTECENIITPKHYIPKSESSSEEKLRASKSPLVMKTPEQLPDEFKKISPCVTLSRGKENARREMLQKMKEGLFDEDESDMDNVECFRHQLSSEIKRMTEMCDTWDNIHKQVSLPEPVQELVLGAVGQARLLMSQKMQQFASLIQECSQPAAGARLVTPADLRGFWDMVFMQVENVDMRFKKLEQLKSRDWVMEEVAVSAAVPRRARARTAPAPAPPRASSAPASRIRDVIAAARKAKIQCQQPPSPVELKTFHGGFFSVHSPARSPGQHSPGQHSPGTPAQRDRSTLLKVVLSSEAQRASASKKCASYAMMRAASLGKCVDTDLDGVSPLPQTPAPNLFATPGKSILKQTQEPSARTNKKIRQVVFDHSDIDPDHNNSTHEPNSKNVDDTKPVDGSVTSDAQQPDLALGECHGDKENRRVTRRLVRQNARSSDQFRIELNETGDLKTPENQIASKNAKSTSKKTTRSSAKKLLEQVDTNIEDVDTKEVKRMMTRHTRNSHTTPQTEPSAPKDKSSRRSERFERRQERKNAELMIAADGNNEVNTPRSTRRRKTLQDV